MFWNNRRTAIAWFVAILASAGSLIVQPAEVAAQKAVKVSPNDIQFFQSELKRIGCYSGEVNGNWAGQSIRGLKRVLQKHYSENPTTNLTSYTNPLFLRQVLRARPVGYCNGWQLTDQYIPSIGYSSRDLTGLTEDNIRTIQRNLNRMGCYKYKIDGLWQEISTRAADLALEYFAFDNPDFDLNQLADPARVIEILRGLPKDYCDGTHDGTLKPASTSTALVCSKDSIGRDYLASRSPQFGAAVNLQQTLDMVVENFNVIFNDPTADYASGLPSGAREQIRLYGVPGVTFDSTKDALRQASSLFAKLSFNHGLKSKSDCRQCYAYNDWVYLRNIAQSNGGFLIGKPTAPDNNNGFKRYPVDWVSSKMLERAYASIKVYRSMTTALNDHLAYIVDLTKALTDPELEKEANKRLPEAQARLKELSAQRDNEMSQLVAGFILEGGNNPEKATGGVFFKDRVAEMSSQCRGFDGSSVDQ